MYTLSYGPGSSSLGALGAVNENIRRLQNALTALATIRGNPAINPGPIDGLIGSKTVNAVLAALPFITDKLGTVGKVAMAGLAILAASKPTEAANLVVSQALTLEIAVLAAAGLSSGGTPQLPPPGGNATPPLPGYMPGNVWYKTWWGMGAIGIGAIGTLALLMSALSPRRPAAA